MEQNYLTYKISGGLTHMLYQINNAVQLSKYTKRHLIIDCYSHSFCNDFNKYFNIPDLDYDTTYDCLYKDTSLSKELFEQYIKPEVIYVDFHQYFLNNQSVMVDARRVINDNSRIVWCTWVEGIDIFGRSPWYIKVNKNIVEQIPVNTIQQPYVGIHYRNTDMKTDLNSIIQKVRHLPPEIETIYLATDDYTAFDAFNSAIGYRFKILQHTKPFNGGGGNIHYGNPDKDEVIMNALIDIYNLSKATHFIGNNKSGLSRKVEEIRVNDNFFK